MPLMHYYLSSQEYFRLAEIDFIYLCNQPAGDLKLKVCEGMTQHFTYITRYSCADHF